VPNDDDDDDESSPRTDHEGPEGSRGMALLLTSALDGVGGHYQLLQIKMFCIYLWCTQDNQIPELTGKSVSIAFYTLFFPLVEK
jgi:hypothetical protein